MAERDLDQEMAALKADVGKLRSDLTNIVEGLKDTGVAATARAKSAVSDLAQPLLDEIRSKFESVSKRGRSSVKAAEQEFEEWPFLSLLAALGTGVVLGKLMHRR